MEYNLEWLINDYQSFLQKFGLDEKSLRDHYPEWQHKSGKSDARDYLWYLFQVILGETARQVKNLTDLQKNNLEIYNAMWFFQTHVEGQPANELQQLINETKIRLWQLELPYYFGVKVNAENCCAYCGQFYQQLLSPEKVLQHEAFVITQCTCESGCQCSISPLALRNEEGKMILKEDRKDLLN